MDNVSGNQPGTAVRRAPIKSKRSKLAVAVAAAVVAVAVVMLSGWFLYRSSTAATIDGSKYQAVFFTNGQVYFGKLNQVNSSYFKLTDVYYIQAQEAENEADSENPQQTSTASTDIRLIKLGSEVHGPEDEMIISKDQILFFENLKKDGKVSDSIIKYNEKQ